MKQPANHKTITLAEVIIIFAILAILSSIIVPELTEAAVDHHEPVLLRELQLLRHATIAYHKDHAESLLDPDKFIAQLTMRTNNAGDIMPSNANKKDYPLGPYLKQVPRNPYVNRLVADRVETGSAGGAGGNAGWYYNTKSGVISPDNDTHCKL